MIHGSWILASFGCTVLRTCQLVWTCVRQMEDGLPVKAAMPTEDGIQNLTPCESAVRAECLITCRS